MRFTEFRKLRIKFNENHITNYKDKRVIKVKDNRTKFKNGFYYIYPIGFDRRQVVIVCPYCGEIHFHGSSDGKYEGPRRPHCLGNHKLNDYYIERL